jgi:hypothetical protein
MPFELGATARGGAEWACRRPTLYGVLRNPVFTAALLTALALVIVFALYRTELRKSGWQLGLKTGVWLLIATSAVVYAHYYALGKWLAQEQDQKGVREVVGGVYAAAVGGGGYQVAPGAAPPPRGADPPAPAPGPSEPSSAGASSAASSSSASSSAASSAPSSSAPPSVAGGAGGGGFRIRDAELPSWQAPAPPRRGRAEAPPRAAKPSRRRGSRRP